MKYKLILLAIAVIIVMGAIGGYIYLKEYKSETQNNVASGSVDSTEDNAQSTSSTANSETKDIEEANESSKDNVISNPSENQETNNNSNAICEDINPEDYYLVSSGELDNYNLYFYESDEQCSENSVLVYSVNKTTCESEIIYDGNIADEYKANMFGKVISADTNQGKIIVFAAYFTACGSGYYGKLKYIGIDNIGSKLIVNNLADVAEMSRYDIVENCIGLVTSDWAEGAHFGEALQHVTVIPFKDYTAIDIGVSQNKYDSNLDFTVQELLDNEPEIKEQVMSLCGE